MKAFGVNTPATALAKKTNAVAVELGNNLWRG
jgi:hypothetical protein